MIQNVVFVLGAGASCPYGFPSGKELRQQIIGHHVTDCHNYLSAVKGPHPLMAGHLDRAKQFVDAFRKSSTKSIDLFLARNPEFSKDGRRAIVFRILAAEQASGFREKTEKRTQDWYTWLFEQMTDELVRKDDYSRFSENDVSIITFNYDRSLEHFLYDSLSNSFKSIAAVKLIEQLDHVRICHVFRQVGPLEWQGQPNGVPYRVDVNQVGIDTLADNIRIVYDEGDNPKLKEAHALLSKAHRVFFLGFGYADENLDALGIPTVLAKVPLVSGTAFGFTKKEIDGVKSRLRAGGSSGDKQTVVIEDRDCLALLRESL
jgi:hypothetical protein